MSTGVTPHQGDHHSPWFVSHGPLLMLPHFLCFGCSSSHLAQCSQTCNLFPCSDEQMQGTALGRKDFWRKMFKSQSAASDTSSQSEQDTSECTTAHSGTTTERRARSRSRRISLRKKLKLPLGKC